MSWSGHTKAPILGEVVLLQLTKPSWQRWDGDIPHPPNAPHPPAMATNGTSSLMSTEGFSMCSQHLPLLSIIPSSPSHGLEEPGEVLGAQPTWSNQLQSSTMTLQRDSL